MILKSNSTVFYLKFLFKFNFHTYIIYIYINELKFDLYNMIVIHEMDIHFMKNTITLCGCDI